MSREEPDAVWTSKGCTLSDKTARKEFGLTQEEIVKAIHRGDLHCRVNSVYGNPFLRLIRSEVEALVEKKHGGVHLKQKKIQAELAQIDKDLKVLERRAADLRKRRAELLAGLNVGNCQHGQRKTISRRARPR